MKLTIIALLSCVINAQLMLAEADAASSDPAVPGSVPKDSGSKEDKGPFWVRALAFMLGMCIGLVIIGIFYLILRVTCGEKLGLKEKKPVKEEDKAGAEENEGGDRDDFFQKV